MIIHNDPAAATVPNVACLAEKMIAEGVVFATRNWNASGAKWASTAKQQQPCEAQGVTVSEYAKPFLQSKQWMSFLRSGQKSV
jgi:hypothetical protein